MTPNPNPNLDPGAEPVDVQGDGSFAIVPVALLDATWSTPDGVERRLSRDAIALYVLLAGRYANRGTHQAFPTYNRLADDLGAGVRSVFRWVDELVAVGAIERTAGRPGTATVFRVGLIVTYRGRRPVDNRPDSGAALPPQTVATATGGSAALPPQTHQPEEGFNQTRARARDTQSEPPRTKLGRGKDAPPLWDLDENGDAVWVGDGPAPTPSHNPHAGDYRGPRRTPPAGA